MRIPPLQLGLALTAPFWLLVYLIAGVWVLGWTLIALGVVWLVACAVLSKQSRPPRFRVLREERIGAFDKRGRMRLSRAELRRRAA